MSGTSVLSWDEYEELLKPLTKELSDAARWIQETDQRVVIVFEGRDTAGKGGSIDVFSRTLNPRQCKIGTSRRSGSGTGWRIPVGGGNFPPSISNPGPDTTNIPRHANGCSRRLIPNGRPGR